MLKQKITGSLQEVILPDFPDDDNTVTTTVTKSRRVSFGPNFVKEFIVDSAISAQCMPEYEQPFPSSDSSSPDSSHSAVGHHSTFVLQENLRIHKSLPPEPEPAHNRPKPPQFASTICFSADSPTADMEFTEGCITLAKTILDKKNKEMTVFIQAKPKGPKEEDKAKEEETKYFDGSQFEMSMTRCMKSKEKKPEDKRFAASENTKIFAKYDDEMSMTRCERFFYDGDGDDIWEESKENRLPLDAIMRHLDKDDSDSDLFNPAGSFGHLLGANPFDHSDESEQLNLNESMEISGGDLEAPQKPSDPAQGEAEPNETSAMELSETPKEVLMEDESPKDTSKEVEMEGESPKEMEIEDDCPKETLKEIETEDKSPKKTSKEMETEYENPKEMEIENANLKETSKEVEMENENSKESSKEVEMEGEGPKEMQMEDESPKETSKEVEMEDENSKMSSKKAEAEDKSPKETLKKAEMEDEDPKEMEMEDENPKETSKNVEMKDENPKESSKEVEMEGAGPKEMEMEDDCPKKSSQEVEMEGEVPKETSKDVEMEDEGPKEMELEDDSPIESTKEVELKDDGPREPSLKASHSNKNLAREVEMEDDTPIETSKEIEDKSPKENIKEVEMQNESLKLSAKELEMKNNSPKERSKEMEMEDDSPQVSTKEDDAPKETSMEVLMESESPKRPSPTAPHSNEPPPTENTTEAEMEDDGPVEPSLGDLKVVESLREQAKEEGCVWSLSHVKHPQKKAQGLLSFRCRLLESTTTVEFTLGMSDEDSLYSCSAVTDSSIRLDEEQGCRVPEYSLAVGFGFEELRKYFGGRGRSVGTVRHVPYYMDEVNSFLWKMNAYVRQIHSVLTSYPGSRLRGCRLSFRLFSFPVFLSCVVFIDLSNVFRLSRGSLSFEHDFGCLDEKKVGEIFEECLKRENCLCEFVVESTRYLVELERQSGYLSKRQHIRLLPAELKS